MKIAVTSATGQLGASIVKVLVSQIGSENVIAIARTPENAQKLGVAVRPGDYKNKSQFQESLQGIDAALLVSGNDDPEKRKKQHANVIDAAAAVGVRKLVYTSVQGPTSNSAFSAVVNSNRHTEEYLKNSGLDWVIGRNGIYIEPDIEYIDHYIEAGKISNCAAEGKCGYTTRSELGYAYAKMLTEDWHHGETYNLNGVPISQQQLADYLNQTFDTHLTYESLSVEAYKVERTVELGESLGTIIAGIYEGIRNNAFDVQSYYAQAAGREHITWPAYFDQLKRQ